jgi:hypothetical protein
MKTIKKENSAGADTNCVQNVHANDNVAAHQASKNYAPVTSLFRSRPLGRAELPERLTTDLEKLSELEFNIDYSEFAIGRWASLALFNRDGDAESSASHEYTGEGRWTAHADHLPAIKDLVTTVFKVKRMLSARIFVAQGGGMIRPHRDYLEFKDGERRSPRKLKYCSSYRLRSLHLIHWKSCSTSQIASTFDTTAAPSIPMTSCYRTLAPNPHASSMRSTGGSISLVFKALRKS